MIKSHAQARKGPHGVLIWRIGAHEENSIAPFERVNTYCPGQQLPTFGTEVRRSAGYRVSVVHARCYRRCDFPWDTGFSSLRVSFGAPDAPQFTRYRG